MHFLLFSIINLIALWLVNILCIMSIFLMLLRIVSKVWVILLKIPWVLKKNVFSVVDVVCKYINYTILADCIEEEKLTFYITSCSFCLCNSACSLKSLDPIGHILVSVTFLEAPERFQPCRPLELPDWWLGQAGTKEPWDERGGAPPDSILGSISDQCSASLDSQAPTVLIGGADQLTRNGHRIR